MYINVEGYKIRYYEKGDGKNILLIHGLGGSIDSWIHNREILSKHFHVVACDLLGFGLSDKPKIRYSISMFVKFVKEFLAKLSIEDVSIIGSSLGGQIATAFALKYPSMVYELILISPAGFTPPYYKGSKELRLYASIFDAKDKEDLKHRLSTLDRESHLSDEYIEFIYSYIKMENSKYAFYSALTNSAKACRLNKKLDMIKSKGMLIWGKEDKIIPVRYCKPFIKTDFRVVLVERCGHRVHYEKPAIFNKLVIDFLESDM
ncbi:MAG: alpha/beta hydrolase [Candidatus Nitrosocaldaceae archaeon]